MMLVIFHELLAMHLYWQNVGSSRLPIFKNWVIFLLSAESYLYIMDMTFVRYTICKYFSQSLVVIFEEQKRLLKCSTCIHMKVLQLYWDTNPTTHVQYSVFQYIRGLGNLPHNKFLEHFHFPKRDPAACHRQLFFQSHHQSWTILSTPCLHWHFTKIPSHNMWSFVTSLFHLTCFQGSSVL